MSESVPSHSGQNLLLNQPLLSNPDSTAPYYGTTSQVDQHELIQRRRKSSMASSRFKDLNLASTSQINGEYQPVETTVFKEVVLMLRSSVPLIITLLLQYSSSISTPFFVGNLGSDELGAVSLANLMANISAFAVIEGISSSLSTLCPQAYGRKNYRLVGLYAVRCCLLLFVFYFGIYFFWNYGAYYLLDRFISEKRACLLAGQYLSRLVYSVPGFIIFEVLKQYLQAQGIFHASTIVLCICAPLNFVLTYLLVWNPTIGFGFLGAPTAIVITHSLMALLLFMYTCLIDGYKCWCGFTYEFFTNWSRITKLALPGIIMIEAEWLAFEINTFASAKFGTPALAAQSIVTSIGVIIYQIPFAVSIAGSTRIAWFIGSASKDAAIKSTRAIIYVAVVFGTLTCIILILLKDSITHLFSKDLDVVHLASKVLIIVSIYQIPDCLSCTLGGVLRGQGRQYIGGYLNLFSYYVLAIPFSFYCAFSLHYELFGLWLGLLVGLFFVASSELYYILTTDWDTIIEQSLEEELEARKQVVLTDEDVAIYDEETQSHNFPNAVAIVDHNILSPAINTSASIKNPINLHV